MRVYAIAARKSFTIKERDTDDTGTLDISQRLAGTGAMPSTGCDGLTRNGSLRARDDVIEVIHASSDRKSCRQSLAALYTYHEGSESSLWSEEILSVWA